MGRARENFNSVYFKDETGVQMSFANGNYANKLVQEDRGTHEVKRYEIMNCTYRELSGKISKKHFPEETPSC